MIIGLREQDAASEPESLSGLLPESWEGFDCGINTAPGCHSRIEMENAIAALRSKTEGVMQTIAAAATEARV